MKLLFEMTRTFPEFNGIVDVTVKEIAKIIKNDHWLNLEEMNRWIKNSFDHMNGVSDNDDLGNIVEVWWLIDTTPNSK